MGSGELCIPIVTDEFAQGDWLNSTLIARPNVFGSLLTFGTDEYTTQDSHLEIIARELGLMDPNFMTLLLHKPEGMSNREWKFKSPLKRIHFCFGSVAVQDEMCVIRVDDSIEPLSFKW